jgi:hypothetical protein
MKLGPLTQLIKSEFHAKRVILRGLPPLRHLGYHEELHEEYLLRALKTHAKLFFEIILAYFRGSVTKDVHPYGLMRSDALFNEATSVEICPV